MSIHILPLANNNENTERSAWRDSYKSEGMLLIKNALNPERIHTILAEIHHCFALQCTAAGITPHAEHKNDALLKDMHALLLADSERYKAAARQSANLLSMLTLLTDSAITNVIKTLGLSSPSIPTSPVINIMAEELKIPGGYHGLEAHQDWPSMQGSLDAVIVWVPMMPVSKERYTLEVIPGSHKNGLLPGTLRPHIFEIAADQYNENDFIPINAEPGDIAFISAFSIHRTGKKGNGVRIACSLRYENLDESTFIERGFPSAYKRSVERHLLTPNFPKPEAVRTLFSQTAR